MTMADSTDRGLTKKGLQETGVSKATRGAVHGKLREQDRRFFFFLGYSQSHQLLRTAFIQAD